MKKIVYIIESLGNSGGMERVLSSKANWLACHGNYEVTILTQFKSENTPFFKFDKKVKIESLNLKRTNNRVTNLVFNTHKKTFKKQLTIKLFEIKPDITISLFGSEYEFLYKINDGSKKIIEFHFSRNYLNHLMESIPNLSFRLLRKWRSKYMQSKERKAATNYDKLVLLTKKDQVMWGNPINSCVIYNPLSFTSDEVSSLNEKQIVGIGRFISQKGFDLLIQAFNQISDEIKGWKLTIYGTGQDEHYLKSLIVERGLEDRIILNPPVKNVKEVFLKSSIFAFPSRYEGFGLVLTEAMECGVPCVAFDCECGPSEIIENEVDGFLIENSNVLQFSERLKALINYKELRIQMGKRAKQNVKRFHIENIMTNWVKLFDID